MKAAVISLAIIVFVAILAVSVMIKFASNLSEEERQRVHGAESYRFGQNVFAKIDASINTKIANRFPYVAAIVRNGSTWNSVCFGSVILHKWLVTSAHCRKADSAKHRVLLLYDFIHNSSRFYDVVYWKTHERFNGTSLYDIAIAALDIKAPLKFKTAIVAEVEINDREVDACIWKTVSSMSRRMYLLNDIERYRLSVAPAERCIDSYNITINESQICVDLSNYEDSFIFEFGPVFWFDNLVGVLTLQPKDGEVKFAIFTNVSYFSPWITQAIEVAPF